MENTTIEWAHHTFSPWIGCTKVSPGCANCYAKAQQEDKYHKVRWGKGMPRKRTSAVYWDQPLKWNRKAMQYHTRFRVFPSLCDPFDPEVSDDWRRDFFALIQKTQFLDWLILTKQVGYAEQYLSKVQGWPWPNVWLGMSAENQEWFDLRWAILHRIKARLHFFSLEPLLGPINLRLEPDCPKPGWAIVGGESGQGHRMIDPAWAVDIHAQCKAAGIPFFMKQGNGPGPGLQGRIPDDLWKVKEFPG